MLDITAAAKPTAPKTVNTKYLACRVGGAAPAQQKAGPVHGGRPRRQDDDALQDWRAGKDRRTGNSASAKSRCPCRRQSGNR